MRDGHTIDVGGGRDGGEVSVPARYGPNGAAEVALRVKGLNQADELEARGDVEQGEPPLQQGCPQFGRRPWCQKSTM